MALYVVNAPGTDEVGLLRARFIKDGFSWPAFVLAQVWLLYHRLWRAFFVWIVLEVAFFILVFPHVAGAVAIFIDLLAHLFLGMEGNRMRQKKALPRAVLVDLVEARDRDEAEAIFYRRQVSEEPASEPVHVAPTLDEDLERA